MGKHQKHNRVAVAAFFAFISVWLLFAAPVYAKVKTKVAGSVVVKAKSETGAIVSGISAIVRLPGADGVLRDDIDVIINKKDGVTDDDAETPGKNVADGDIELPPKLMERGIKDGQPFEVVVSAGGFVENSGVFKYSSKKANELEINLKHAISVEAVDSNKNSLPGFSVSIDKKIAGVDGGDNDADKKANGVFLFAKDIMDNRNDKMIDVQVELKGVKKIAGQQQVSTKVQRPIRVIMNGAEKK